MVHKRTQGDGLAVKRAGGGPSTAVPVLAAVAQQRVPAVRALPRRVGVGLLHILPVPHQQAVAAEDTLLEGTRRNT